MKNKLFTLVRKPGIFAFIITMSLVMAITGCFSDDGDDDPVKAEIVCLGDSLTAGMSAVTPFVDDKSKSYPAYLQNKVTVTVANAGVSGETTAQALARVQNDVIAKDPDIVVICLGANDFFQADTEAEMNAMLTTAESNMTEIVEALDNKARRIFIAKFYNDSVARAKLSAAGITDTTAQTTWINQCDAMFGRLVALTTTNAELFLINDIWTGVFDGTDTMSTGSNDPHPNAAGYEVMANNYFSAMQTELNELGWVK